MIFFLLFFFSSANADVTPAPAHPEYEKILKNFDERLKKLTTKAKWQSYVRNNKIYWPDLTENSPTSTIVIKEDLKIDNDVYPIGVGNREAFIKTTLSKFKTFLNSPQLYQFAYGLDAPANAPERVPPTTDSPLKSPHEFLTRIFKKVPGIEDQDYTLKNKLTQEKGILFVRASLLEDRKQFALRDNLKVLEEVPGGVVIREISIVYPLRWYVRLFYGATIDIMKKEMTKISLSEKCILENDPKSILNPETSKKCWDKVSKG